MGNKDKAIHKIERITKKVGKQVDYDIEFYNPDVVQCKTDKEDEIYKVIAGFMLKDFPVRINDKELKGVAGINIGVTVIYNKDDSLSEIILEKVAIDRTDSNKDISLLQADTKDYQKLKDLRDKVKQYMKSLIN